MINSKRKLNFKRKIIDPECLYVVYNFFKINCKISLHKKYFSFECLNICIYPKSISEIFNLSKNYLF